MAGGDRTDKAVLLHLLQPTTRDGARVRTRATVRQFDSELSAEDPVQEGHCKEAPVPNRKLRKAWSTNFNLPVSRFSLPHTNPRAQQRNDSALERSA